MNHRNGRIKRFITASDVLLGNQIGLAARNVGRPQNGGVQDAACKCGQEGGRIRRDCDQSQRQIAACFGQIHVLGAGRVQNAIAVGRHVQIKLVACRANEPQQRSQRDAVTGNIRAGV